MKIIIHKYKNNYSNVEKKNKRFIFKTIYDK